MKRFKVIFLLIAVVSLSGVCFGSNNITVNVRAHIPSEFGLTHWIRGCPWNSTPFGTGSFDATEINFGDLVWEVDKWRADKYFTVFLLVTNNEGPYRITQSSTGFYSGSADLNSHVIVTPGYENADEWSPGSPQGAKPAGDSEGEASLAAVTGHVIYNGNSGEARIVRAYYGIATDAPGEPAGAEPITGDQTAGTYTGTVTFSLVAQ